jgi:hypothetical protein
MNRINFKGKDGGGFHHLTPYQKKSRVRNVKIIKNDQKIDDMGIGDWYLTRPIILNKPIQQVTKIIDDNIIQVIHNPEEYSHKKGFKSFHSHTLFKKGFQELAVTDSIGGCGMQQLYGWTKIKDVETGIELLKHYLSVRRYGVGLVICQLGQGYFNGSFEQALVHCGFKVSEEYSNYQHCHHGTYKQRIYSLKLKYKND